MKIDPLTRSAKQIADMVSKVFVDVMAEHQTLLGLNNVEAIALGQTALAVIIGETSVAFSAIGADNEDFVEMVKRALDTKEIRDLRKLAKERFFCWRRKQNIKEVK